MPVGPDLLLQTTPDVTPRAAPKGPAKPAGSSQDGPSSFSKVYRDNQAKPSDGAASKVAKPGAEKPAGPAAAASTDAPAATELSAESGVSGKGLPLEDDAPPEEGMLDPLVMFGLVETPLPMAPLMPTASVGDLTPQATEPGLGIPGDTDPEAIKADLSILGQLGARSTMQAATVAADALPDEQVAQPTADEGFVEIAKLVSDTLTSGKANDEGEASLSTLELALPDNPTEAKTADLRSDQFVSRLNALGQAMTPAAGQAERAPVLTPGQPVALHQNGWTEAVVDRVMWLSSQNLKSADIQLHPLELGRLEVRIQMDQDQTQVTFASANAGVREALDSQMHRLREMFAQQGMNQLDVNVSDQSMNRGWGGQQAQADSNAQGQQRGGRGEAGDAGDVDSGASIEALSSTPLRAGRGLVDYYA
ncbi:flagellar hook-length control protein FliK [Pseudomonas sp. Marseille-QA0892]